MDQRSLGWDDQVAAVEALQAARSILDLGVTPVQVYWLAAQCDKSHARVEEERTGELGVFKPEDEYLVCELCEARMAKSGHLKVQEWRLLRG